jgi:hypothetical protein
LKIYKKFIDYIYALNVGEYNRILHIIVKNQIFSKTNNFKKKVHSQLCYLEEFFFERILLKCIK